MAGKGKGTAADYLSGKRTRDGGPKTVFRSDYLFSSRDVEDSRNGGINININLPIIVTCWNGMYLAFRVSWKIYFVV